MDETIIYLKLWNIKFAKISASSFTISVGISTPGAAFEVSSYFVSLKTSSNVSVKKKGFTFYIFLSLLIY